MLRFSTKMLIFQLICINFIIHSFDKGSLNLYNEVTKLKEAILCQYVAKMQVKELLTEKYPLSEEFKESDKF